MTPWSPGLASPDPALRRSGSLPLSLAEDVEMEEGGKWGWEVKENNDGGKGDSGEKRKAGRKKFMQNSIKLITGLEGAAVECLGKSLGLVNVRGRHPPGLLL